MYTTVTSKGRSVRADYEGGAYIDLTFGGGSHNPTEVINVWDCVTNESTIDYELESSNHSRRGIRQAVREWIASNDIEWPTWYEDYLENGKVLRMTDTMWQRQAQKLDEPSRSRTMMQLEKVTREMLRERWDYLDANEKKTTLAQDEPHDIIHETADGAVPIYTSHILGLAADSPNLAVQEPELGPAFDGTPTPVNIIAANIYERLQDVCWDEWERIKKETEDE